MGDARLIRYQEQFLIGGHQIRRSFVQGAAPGLRSVPRAPPLRLALHPGGHKAHVEVVPYLIAEPVQIQMFFGPLYHRQFIDTQEAADHSGDRDAVFLPRNPAGAVECVIFEVQLCQELSGRLTEKVPHLRAETIRGDRPQGNSTVIRKCLDGGFPLPTSGVQGFRDHGGHIRDIPHLLRGKPCRALRVPDLKVTVHKTAAPFY